MKLLCSRRGNSSNPVYVAPAFGRAFVRIQHARLKAGATKSFEQSSRGEMLGENEDASFL
jgi:hypothetical protein